MGYSKEEQERIERTGSNNISKASPEWKVILEQAREEHKSCEGTDCQYDIHHAYSLLNKQAEEEKIPWNKCVNCGSPYRLDRDDVGSTACSPDCHAEYLASVMDGW